MSNPRKPKPNINLFVIFCDDIRQEVGGKITIVGAYQTKMIFPQFPALQPRLGAFMHASINGKSLKKLTFNLYKNDELLDSINIDSDIQKSNDFQAAFMVGPLTFDSPCTLRSELVTETETIIGRSLEVLSIKDINPETT